MVPSVGAPSQEFVLSGCGPCTSHPQIGPHGTFPHLQFSLRNLEM